MSQQPDRDDDQGAQSSADTESTTDAKSTPGADSSDDLGAELREDAKAAAAQVADAGVRTLYALAGLTDAVAEQLRKQAVAASDARQQRAAEREARSGEDAEKLRRAVNEAPEQLKNLPDALREQLDKFIEAFDELAGRGRDRVNQVREQMAANVRAGAREGRAEADEATERAGTQAREAADEAVQEADHLADEIDPRQQ